jgi:hypothetical protein
MADELDGLEDSAGGLALPDFAEAALSERLDEAISGDGLGTGLTTHQLCLLHGRTLRERAGALRRSPGVIED